jgi:DNA-directed RNA polymerase specialized sigma24 family protein
MMDWNRIKEWDYVIDAVASEYSKRFKMVELKDIKQSLYQWFFEHPNKLNEWEKIGEKDAKNLIYRSLRNHALDYCQEWKANTSGYETSDLYYYEAGLVEALLPSVLRGEISIGHKLDLGGVTGTRAPAEGGNLMAMMIEIDYAYWKLSKDDRKILFLRHAETLEYKLIADILELGSEDTARMRQRRALNRLIRKLGGFKPYNDVDLEKQDEDSTDTEEQLTKTEQETE